MLANNVKKPKTMTQKTQRAQLKLPGTQAAGMQHRQKQRTGVYNGQDFPF